MGLRISELELGRRSRRIGYGLLFSLLLVVAIAGQHHANPDDYSRAWMWSVIGFVALANLVNYLRHRRYLGRARSHRLELVEKRLRFHTGTETSELLLTDVAALRVFRRGERIGHVQLKLRNGRGIRLEGYEDMEGLTEALIRLLPGKLMGGA